MARFNKKAQDNFKTKNYEDAVSYKVSPELQLYSIVCTSALQPTFYVPNTEKQLQNIRELLNLVDPLFAAKLTVYAREKMYLRTIPLVLTVELCKILQNKSNGLIRTLTNRVIQRADEITELLAYYIKSNEIEPKPAPTPDGNYVGVYKEIYSLSNQIRRGLRDVFESGKFNEYNYAKYNRDTKIKLKDAMFLAKPKPKNQELVTLFEKIANDNLETPYTWEVELSKAGQSGVSKKDVWESLIDSNEVGYMALLRNMRNIVEAPVSAEHIYKVAKRISDPTQVRKSKQLPFRFLSAYRSLGQNPNIRRIITSMDKPLAEYSAPAPFLRALESAVLTSIENIPMFKGERVLIASDVSGSMQTPISERSKIQLFDIGILMSCLLRHRCSRATIGMFGDTWKVINDLPMDNVLESTNIMHSREGEVGYSTNGWRVLDWALKEKDSYDRIMIFTDCQMWNSTSLNRSTTINNLWAKYNGFYPKSKLYLFNLAPYNAGSPIDMRNGNVHLISGWSDSIFTVLSNIERGEDALDEIKEINL